MAQNRILYLSYDGMTDPLGQSQVLPYLQGLAAGGYDITLLSFEKPDKYGSKRAMIQEICDRSGITWSPLMYTKQPPVLSTVYDVMRMIRKGKALYKQKPFDYVHCRGYISAIGGLSLKKRFGCKYIFDMRGFYVEERVDMGLWNISNPVFKLVYKYFRMVEADSYRLADKIIVLTESAKRAIVAMKEHGVPPERIQVIPCCVDTELFTPEQVSEADRQRAREALGIREGDFVVTYLGSLGTWYMFDEMLEFFKLLKARKPAARFLVLSGADQEFVAQTVAKHGLQPDDVILQFSERKALPVYLSLADLSLFFYRSGFSNKGCSPTKMGELMAMGIPMVASEAVGDVDELLVRYGAGWSTTLDAGAYEKVIDRLIAEESAMHSDDIRRGAIDYYSLDKGIEKYNRVYSSLQA